MTSIAPQLQFVQQAVETASLKQRQSQTHVSPPSFHDVRLVAVSKTQPASAIRIAYDAGQRHFGENYVQEFKEKVPQLPDDIEWHFIGHLQTNKVKDVVCFPNLFVIETIDSEKLASAVNLGWSKTLAKYSIQRPLHVFVQVNTSREENKCGVLPESALPLCQFIIQSCPFLQLCGLMTIGKYDCEYVNGINPDFQCLLECRKSVCQQLGIPVHEWELSMGMSSDFEHAIEMGSTNVRVGSTIFGPRNTK